MESLIPSLSTHQLTIGLIIYNNPIDEIERCLQSIYSQQFPQDKIQIIIRNQGNNHTLEQIQQLIQERSWYNIEAYQGRNIGFGAGHNDIFSRISTQSKAYLCLNPDGFLHPDALVELIKIADFNNWQGIFEAIHEPIMHPKYFDPKTGVTAWCSGACVLIPVNIYQSINGFDEDFFLYCEDVDLSWRVKAMGYQCFTCANALFFHYAMDRKDRELEIWKAAVLLAHKWRSVNFKQYAVHMWKKYMDLSDEDLEIQLNKIQPHSITDVEKAIPEFNQGLYFSKAMWR
ncbi:glycosyltransferase family 2 protein [Snodgrassella communis]|uniref:glycosyltransferase family 2 protein n=1 Tax=Snodgrassella communis TaxID=2946699 RepID=UPI001EF4FED4|nr:glycosyltransferase family 2 protein [Snodgrassella communis]